jgi:hypothetical protein
MRNFLSTVSILFSVIAATHAQITITSADIANGGDTVRMSTRTDFPFDYTTAGPGMTWDFSGLTPSAQIVKQFGSISTAGLLCQVQMGSFAPPAYQATYFVQSNNLPLDQASAFLPVTIDAVNEFDKKTATALTIVGLGLSIQGNEIPFRSDTIETIFNFPVAFGDVAYSNGYTNIDLTQFTDVQWKQYRTRSTEVDGHGTIITPFGTFSALRVRHDITELDSIYLNVGFPFWLPIPQTFVEYEWWANGQKAPILKVVTNSIFGNEVIRSVEYRDVNRYLDAGVENVTNDMKVFPNPASDELTVNAGNVIESLRIFDQNGRLVKEEYQLQSQTALLNISALNSGSYLLVLTTSTGISHTTFVKK